MHSRRKSTDRLNDHTTLALKLRFTTKISWAYNQAPRFDIVEVAPYARPPADRRHAFHSNGVKR